MKAIVAIKSLEQNAYFHDKASRLFSDLKYADHRPTETEMSEFLSGSDVVIIGAKEKITENVLRKVINPPSIIGTLSIGVDHLDLNFLNSLGIKIINAPSANVLSVAEHVMAFAFSLVKKLKCSDIAVQNGTGRESISTPIELNGKVFGLVGYGKIAKKIALFAKCFGMKVIATSQTRVSGEEDGVRFYTLQEVLSRANVISINVPLNLSTTKLINSETLKFLRKSSVIINTSRSEVVDHDAILEYLNNGILSGYAEDSDHLPRLLSSRTDVICSPHIAGLTKEASDRLDNELIDRIETYLASS